MFKKPSRGKIDKDYFSPTYSLVIDLELHFVTNSFAGLSRQESICVKQLLAEDFLVVWEIVLKIEKSQLFRVFAELLCGLKLYHLILRDTKITMNFK